MAEGERLQKILARAGYGSRRACETLIEAGRVRVDGHVASLGDRADPTRDRIEVDGVEVSVAETDVYYALHKPTGVVTTASDPRGRPTVLDLVPDEPRVFPVGRLDQDTSGLLLLTNDGDFANRVTHPRYGVEKTYLAQVRGRANRDHVRQLRSGVELEDGVVHVEQAEIVASHGQRSLVELIVHEGRNRMVRRLLEHLGLPIEKLARTAIGPVLLGNLGEGKWRRLDRSEVVALLRASAADT